VESTGSSLDEFYDSYERIEAAFQAALDESLQPRGPDLLYEMVRDLRLPPGATALDLGCGKGAHSVRLAQDFGLKVIGVDPVARHIEQCNEGLEEAAAESPQLRRLVRFETGVAEQLPLDDASVDLIWCREVLYTINALDAALIECRRVLRPGSHMLVYQQVAGDRLEPREAERQWAVGGIVPDNADAQHVEAAFTRAGFDVVQRLDLGSEFGEYAAEHGGEPGHRLLHAARLLRDPERYIAQFGQTAYDIMLADCFWHIHRMIGKLSSRVYLLRKGDG
jgi:ubiquinone/menaquinone biosynthesis C-methylase UbiE